MAEKIDFPPDPKESEVYRAENGIDYICVSEDPVIWRVVESQTASGQRLWARDDTFKQIFPVFAGDDVTVRDPNGNITTRIVSGGVDPDPEAEGAQEVPKLITPNISFSHLPPLSVAPSP